jgi:predicted HicB family RNase H-like nuclease
MKNYLEYDDYIGTVNYSAEDDVFYGKIEGINDLVLFEGESVSELKGNFKEAINDYLTTCEELGKEPNKVYKGVFNVRVPSNIHKKLSIIASKNGLKLNELVKKTFNYLVENENKILN